MKLFLSKSVQNLVDEILAPLRNPEAWAALKLPFAPTASAIVRMEGGPGTGKTALAHHMAKKLNTPPLHLSFAGVASTQFGETENKIKALFDAAHETRTSTLIMEECDAILWSRSKVTEDTMYVLGIVNTLLVEIDRLKARTDVPSLLILTTNYPQLLDEAMESRVTDVISLSSPVGEHAQRLWKAKLPKLMSDAITEAELKQLAALGATPRQIENAILRICRSAMHRNVNPQFSDFNLP